MTFGMAGAHRTGKTTIASMLADETGITYHDASVSKIMKEAGINPVASISLADRMPAQEFLLDRYLSDLEALPRPFITDRTPLDMIGYMLGEVTMHNSSPEMAKRIDLYVDRCIIATRQIFDSIIFLRPLVEYKVDPDKPPPNPAYQWETQFIIEGSYQLITSQVNAIFLPAASVDERMAHSMNFVASRIEAMQTKLKKMILH